MRSRPSAGCVSLIWWNWRRKGDSHEKRNDGQWCRKPRVLLLVFLSGCCAMIRVFPCLHPSLSCPILFKICVYKTEVSPWHWTTSQFTPLPSCPQSCPLLPPQSVCLSPSPPITRTPPHPLVAWPSKMDLESSPDLERMAYVPLSVSVVPQPPHPGDAPAGGAALVFMAPPYCWLDIGTPVHLHIAAAPTFFSGPCRCPRLRTLSNPLAIRGWIVAEWDRTERTVKYMVRNEETHALAQYTTIQFGPLPGIRPPPRGLDVNAERIPARTGYLSEKPWRVTGPHGPVVQLGGLPQGRAREEWRPNDGTFPSLEQEAGPRGGRANEDGGESEGSRLVTMNPGPPLAVARVRASAARPYTMWETYGGRVISRAARAEEDGIRNYGRPIVVRPRERGDGSRA